MAAVIGRAANKHAYTQWLPTPGRSVPSASGDVTDLDFPAPMDE